MKHQLELRHFRYFMAVAEDLHFRKAADRLYIAQPGLSRQIQQLEAILGTTLFIRHNRKVELSEAGSFLKTHLKKYFNELDQLLHQTKLVGEGYLGELRLGYVGSAMQQVIPQLLVTFRKQYPDVLFNLKEMENGDQIEALINHQIDIGFVRQDRVPRGLTMHTVLEEPFCLVLPEEHPLRDENFQNLSQLKEESFILFDPTYSTFYFEKVMQIFDESGFSPRISHNTIHASSIYQLVAHGFGLSIVPKSLRMDYQPGIRFIDLTHSVHRTTLSAVWNPTSRNSILDHFTGLLKEGLFTFK